MKPTNHRPGFVQALLLAGLMTGAAAIPAQQSATGSTQQQTTSSQRLSGQPGTTGQQQSLQANKNIMETARSAGTFTQFVQLAEKAGIANTLNGAGPFTVFAPTDEAFGKLPQETRDRLMNNPQELRQVLLGHVVNGHYNSRNLINLNNTPSLQGGNLAITSKGDHLMVGGANVILPDVKATNGTIHIIDRVITPGAAQTDATVSAASATGARASTTAKTSASQSQRTNTEAGLTAGSGAAVTEDEERSHPSQQRDGRQSSVSSGSDRDLSVLGSSSSYGTGNQAGTSNVSTGMATTDKDRSFSAYDSYNTYQPDASQSLSSIPAGATTRNSQPYVDAESPVTGSELDRPFGGAVGNASSTIRSTDEAMSGSRGTQQSFGSGTSSLSDNDRTYGVAGAYRNGQIDPNPNDQRNGQSSTNTSPWDSGRSSSTTSLSEDQRTYGVAGAYRDGQINPNPNARRGQNDSSSERTTLFGSSSSAVIPTERDGTNSGSRSTSASQDVARRSSAASTQPREQSVMISPGDAKNQEILANSTTTGNSTSSFSTDRQDVLVMEDDKKEVEQGTRASAQASASKTSASTSKSSSAPEGSTLDRSHSDDVPHERIESIEGTRSSATVRSSSTSSMHEEDVYGSAEGYEGRTIPGEKINEYEDWKNADVLGTDVGQRASSSVVIGSRSSGSAMAVSDPIQIRDAQNQQQLPAVIDVLNNAKMYSKLVSLIREAGLEQELVNRGEFTLLAPTDDAFTKLPADRLEKLRADKEGLRQLLLNHVIDGRLSAARLADKQNMPKPLSDKNLTISDVNGKLSIGPAKVVAADLAAKNAIIHGIDTVITTPVKD